MKAVMSENVWSALRDSEARVGLRKALKKLVDQAPDIVPSHEIQSFDLGNQKVFLTFTRPAKQKK